MGWLHNVSLHITGTTFHRHSSLFFPRAPNLHRAIFPDHLQQLFESNHSLFILPCPPSGRRSWGPCPLQTSRRNSKARRERPRCFWQVCCAHSICRMNVGRMLHECRMCQCVVQSILFLQGVTLQRGGFAVGAYSSLPHFVSMHDRNFLIYCVLPLSIELNIEFHEIVSEHKFNRIALHWAASNGHVDVAEYLPPKSITALQYIILWTRYLVGQGSDVNAQVNSVPRPPTAECDTFSRAFLRDAGCLLLMRQFVGCARQIACGHGQGMRVTNDNDRGYNYSP